MMAHFTLAHFEGSLDFLLCLIQKQELDIIDIPIQEIIHQFIQQLNNHQEELEATFTISSQDSGERDKSRSKRNGLNEEDMAKAMSDEEDRSRAVAAVQILDEIVKVADLDQGAEFIKNAAYLMWLKSQMLLPQRIQDLSEEESEDLQVMDYLVDYCRFKQAAKTLALRQEQQQACYFRGIETPEWRKPLGIDHISLEELTLLFKEMMRTQDKPLIQEGQWRLSDKLHIIRCLLQEQSSLLFSSLFLTVQSRLEMIVIFLAVLELMKSGELYVGREQTSVLIFAKE
jgi:segregation and condensation protein A